MTERSVDLVPNLVRGHRSNGRCKYDAAAKQELVLRCLQPGVSLAGMALAHGLNANLLRKWVVMYARRNRIATTIDGRRRAPPVLLPVKAVPERPVSEPATGSYLEIAVSGAKIRIYGRVDAAPLRGVIDCLVRRA